MRYLVLLMGPGELPPWGELSAAEQEEAMGRFADFDAACAARDGVSILAGEAPGNLIALCRQTFGLDEEQWGKDLAGGDYPWTAR